MKPLIEISLARKILFLGVSLSTKGGMTSVLVSYNQYIPGMRFIPTWKLGSKITKAWYMVQAVCRTYFQLCLHQEIEIVHIHAAANASFSRARIFSHIAKFFGRKVIIHEHAADFKEFFNKSTRKKEIVDTLNSAHHIIVLSNSWREYFTQIGVDKQKISIINNIVSPPDISTCSPSSSSHTTLRLLYLGEVSQRKGIHDLIEVIAANREEFSGNVELKIGGNIVDFNIASAIEKYNLSELVTYEGWVSGDKKHKCLQWADVYILPSYNEGLPIAVLEAMAYGKPVISTTVGGIPEVISQGINGFLIRPGDTKSLTSAIKNLINNPEKINSMGLESKKAVKPFFPESVFSQLNRIYSSLL